MRYVQLPTVDVEKLADADSTAKAKLEQTVDTLSHMTPEEAVKSVGIWFLEFALKILAAVVVWYVGRWVIKKIKQFLEKIFERRNVDASLRTFLLSLTSITLTIILLVFVVDIIGLSTTSFLALFASAGLALGVALSGTLQNFAGGVMLLALKPYRVGDYIQAQGQEGTVRSIQLFNTIIATPDNKTIIIPNGGISTGIINNFSRESMRRVDFTIYLRYGDDMARAKKVVKVLVAADERIVRTPAPIIEPNKLGESSIEFIVQVWTKSSEYGNVQYSLNEKMQRELPANGIHFAVRRIEVVTREDHRETDSEGLPPSVGSRSSSQVGHFATVDPAGLVNSDGTPMETGKAAEAITDENNGNISLQETKRSSQRIQSPAEDTALFSNTPDMGSNTTGGSGSK